MLLRCHRSSDDGMLEGIWINFVHVDSWMEVILFLNSQNKKNIATHYRKMIQRTLFLWQFSLLLLQLYRGIWKDCIIRCSSVQIGSHSCQGIQIYDKHTMNEWMDGWMCIVAQVHIKCFRSDVMFIWFVITLARLWKGNVACVLTHLVCWIGSRQSLRQREVRRPLTGMIWRARV